MLLNLFNVYHDPVFPLALPFPPSDVDECEKGNVCFQGQCLNTDGSFQCVCEAGYKFSAQTADCEGIVLCVCVHVCSHSEQHLCEHDLKCTAAVILQYRHVLNSQKNLDFFCKPKNMESNQKMKPKNAHFQRIVLTEKDVFLQGR